MHKALVAYQLSIVKIISKKKIDQYFLGTNEKYMQDRQQRETSETYRQIKKCTQPKERIDQRRN